jgi:hypothetical protein
MSFLALCSPQKISRESFIASIKWVHFYNFALYEECRLLGYSSSLGATALGKPWPP